jgi:hypothetical protein
MGVSKVAGHFQRSQSFRRYFAEQVGRYRPGQRTGLAHAREDAAELGYSELRQGLQRTLDEAGQTARRRH